MISEILMPRPSCPRGNAGPSRPRRPLANPPAAPARLILLFLLSGGLGGAPTIGRPGPVPGPAAAAGQLLGGVRLTDVLRDRSAAHLDDAAAADGGGIGDFGSVGSDGVPSSSKGRGGAVRAGDVEELYLTQRLDHFSALRSPGQYLGAGGGVRGGDARTFQQRYFYSRRYVSNPGPKSDAPGVRGDGFASPSLDDDRDEFAFLCVGGEGPALDASVLVDSVHCTGDMIETARRVREESGADVHLFSLEHRYYGKSYPRFEDKEGGEESPVLSKNLEYLSSRQALADIAAFVSRMNGRAAGVFRPRTDGRSIRWVAFGGSYPGMLSAWSRLRFPHLIHASVSNSAPVQPRLNFSSYNDRVAADLSNGSIGGGEECLAAMREGHGEISILLRSGTEVERSAVAGMFRLCGGEESLRDGRNVGMFLGDGVVRVYAQGNDPSCEGDLCNIGKLCSELLRERRSYSAMEALAVVAAKQTRGENCTDVDWSRALRYISSPEAQEGGLRSWLWQTCTEFGFYQTCEIGSSCPFGKGFHSTDVDLEICQVAFGIEEEMVRANIQETLDYYGGWDLGKDGGASRILSVNGDIDPWSELALTPEHVTKNINLEMPTFWVRGASHHYWTHPVNEMDDSTDIVTARENIYSQVFEWIKGKEGTAQATMLKAANLPKEAL